MIKVFYNSKTNAFLGGEMFRDGIAVFKDDEEGIVFANRYFLKYEEIEEEKPATPKKRVKKNG